MTQDITKPSGIIRSAYFKSSTGQHYWVDAAGKATPVDEGEYLVNSILSGEPDETAMRKAAEEVAWENGGREAYRAWDAAGDRF